MGKLIKKETFTIKIKDAAYDNNTFDKKELKIYEFKFYEPKWWEFKLRFENKFCADYFFAYNSIDALVLYSEEMNNNNFCYSTVKWGEVSNEYALIHANTFDGCITEKEIYKGKTMEEIIKSDNRVRGLFGTTEN